MKRQGKIRISVRKALIHQTAPIEEGSDDNGKCVAILRHRGGHFHITVACIGDACPNDWTACHNGDATPLCRRTHSRVINKAPFWRPEFTAPPPAPTCTEPGESIRL